jgi:hypothetical protein
MAIFSEALVHSATRVLSDRRRVSLFTWVGAQWMAHDPAKTPSEHGRFVDEGLKHFFRQAVPGDDQGD